MHLVINAKERSSDDERNARFGDVFLVCSRNREAK